MSQYAPTALSYLLIRKRGKRRNGERRDGKRERSALIHGLFYNCQGWARLPLEARNSIQETNMVSQQGFNYLGHHQLPSMVLSRKVELGVQLRPEVRHSGRGYTHLMMF